jgi:Mrp family chromosome partitioning ATPase
VLAAGQAGSAASLTDPALPRLLDELTSGSDLLVIDGPPAAEAIPLLGSCDAVLLVAGAEQPAEVAAPLARELAARDAPVRGLIVNRASGRLRPR